MEWKNSVEAVARMSEDARRRYFDMFPDRERWFQKNYPEMFGVDDSGEQDVNHGRQSLSDLKTVSEQESFRLAKLYRQQSIQNDHYFGGVRPDDAWNDHKLINSIREDKEMYPEGDTYTLSEETDPSSVEGVEEIPLDDFMPKKKSTESLLAAIKERKSINESTPPGMEGWVRDRKEGFKQQYGDRWEEVLNAAAWEEYNKRNG
jgi:hypothetical protein